MPKQEDDKAATSLIAKCNSFYRGGKDEDELCKSLLSSQKEIFLAIIARISQGDSKEQLQIKKEGLTLVPTLDRRISLLD